MLVTNRVLYSNPVPPNQIAKPALIPFESCSTLATINGQLHVQQNNINIPITIFSINTIISSKMGEGEKDTFHVTWNFFFQFDKNVILASNLILAFALHIFATLIFFLARGKSMNSKIIAIIIISNTSRITQTLDERIAGKSILSSSVKQQSILQRKELAFTWLSHILARMYGMHFLSIYWQGFRVLFRLPFSNNRSSLLFPSIRPIGAQ